VNVATQNGSPQGVLGVFFVLLGAGLVFDGDWQWRGGSMMAVGVACLVIAARRGREGNR
jgi:hypothetical protein